MNLERRIQATSARLAEQQRQLLKHWHQHPLSRLPFRQLAVVTTLATVLLAQHPLGRRILTLARTALILRHLLPPASPLKPTKDAP